MKSSRGSGTLSQVLEPRRDFVGLCLVLARVASPHNAAERPCGARREGVKQRPCRWHDFHSRPGFQAFLPTSYSTNW